MDDDEPGAKYVDAVVEVVGVGDAVECSTAGQNEEQDLRDCADSGHVSSFVIHSRSGNNHRT